MRASGTFLALVVLVGLAACDVRADLATPKWIQSPDLTVYGVDVKVVPGGLADDFLCSMILPLGDIHVWGSWKNDDVAAAANLAFRLSIWSDQPRVAADWSRPKDELWFEWFQPADANWHGLLYATAVEDWFDPVAGLFLDDNHQQVWQYNFYPKQPFVQQGTGSNPIVYWLKIEAAVSGPDAGKEFGWKTSVTHFSDDAVYWTGSAWGELLYPAGHPFHDDPVTWGENSMDLAFALTPEPATLALVVLGAAGVWGARRRR